jgi:hypothetical protein
MAKNFTWHEVSEKEKEEIRQESKSLLANFASKLEKIKAPEGHFSKEKGYREEGNGWNTSPEFKALMFENAPFVEDDTIIAEKGAWK